MKTDEEFRDKRIYAIEGVVPPCQGDTASVECGEFPQSAKAAGGGYQAISEGKNSATRSS